MDNSQSQPKAYSFQEALTIFGGLTGLIVAILWQAGRFYVSGFYRAMNIPPFQITFSIWEYAEVSWFRLLAYIATTLALPIFIITLGYAGIFLFAFLLEKITRLKLADAIDQIFSLTRKIWGRAKSSIIAVSLLLVLSFLTASFIQLYNYGKLDGQRTILSKSHTVEIFSNEALPIGSSTIYKNTNPPLFHYSNLILLTFNSGKYYLFSDIDPTTCKPKQVFIIRETEDIHVVLGDIAVFNETCEEASSDAFMDSLSPIFTP